MSFIYAKFKDSTHGCLLQFYAWCIFGVGRGFKGTGKCVGKLGAKLTSRQGHRAEREGLILRSHYKPKWINPLRQALCGDFIDNIQ